MASPTLPSSPHTDCTLDDFVPDLVDQSQTLSSISSRFRNIQFPEMKLDSVSSSIATAKKLSSVAQAMTSSTLESIAYVDQRIDLVRRLNQELKADLVQAHETESLLALMYAKSKVLIAQDAKNYDASMDAWNDTPEDAFEELELLRPTGVKTNTDIPPVPDHRPVPDADSIYESFKTSKCHRLLIDPFIHS